MSKLWITIIILFLLNVWQSWLLFKKPTTHNETNNEIDKLIQRNKRIKDANVNNDISASISDNKPTKERKQRKERKFRIFKRSKK